MEARVAGVIAGALTVAVLACGGTVVTEDSGESGGSAATGGSTGGAGGTAGSGGFTGGAGGSVGGSGGSSVGGSGGSVGGSGGSSVGGSGAATGGSGGDEPVCPPMPSCNWCGGESVLDDNGCVVGYVCANGVDPCVTQPCSTSGDCPPGEYCDPMGLCWPPDLTCSEPICVGNESQCNCNWECSDGSTYESHCKTHGMEQTCDCFVDNIPTASCDQGAAGGSCESNCCMYQ